MSTRGKKSKVTIAGHTLTYAELYVLKAIKEYMRSNSGVGVVIPLSQIFPASAKRHSARRLAALGVLEVCQIKLLDDAVRILPLL